MPDPVLWDLDDHTSAKHRVLRAYLDAWIPIMGQQAIKVRARQEDKPRLLLVDGFAGPGRYTRGEPGSPLIMLDALASHAASERIKDVTFIYLFIEQDQRRAEHLESELSKLRLPPNAQVHVEHGAFEETFRDLVENVTEGHTLIPTFAFIDPFGYSAASMSLTGRFLGFRRTEALFFLPLSFIHRFVGRTGQETALTALFDSEDWREAIALKGEERSAFLLGLFEHQLQSQGQVEHVRSFQLRTRDGNDYRLVFATGHERGLDIIKQAMWSVDPIAGTRYVAQTETGQEVLFQSAVDTGPLIDALRAAFGVEWFTVKEASRATLLRTPFLHGSHLKRLTLVPAERAGLIEVQRPEAKRAGTFTDDVRLRFIDP